jgi:hypothetical protein
MKYSLSGKYSANFATAPKHVRFHIDKINEYSNNPIRKRLQNHELASLARELVNNNPLGHGAIHALIGRILSNGLKITLEVGEKLSKSITEKFLVWILIAFKQPLREVLRSITYNYLVDGEVFIVKINDNLYKIIPTEKCPLHFNSVKQNIKNGIQYDNFLNIKGYVFYDDCIPSRNKRVPHKNKGEIIPVENVLHIANTYDLEIDRGVTVLHAAFSTFHSIDSILKNELESTRIAAVMLAQIVKDLDSLQYESNEEDFKTDRHNTHEIENSPILFNNLPPGHEIKLLTTGNRGHGQLEEFLNSQMRLISRTLGLTPSVTTGKYDSNFSSERMAAIDATLSIIATHQDRVVNVINELFIRFLKASKISQINFKIKFNELPVIDEVKHAKAEEIRQRLKKEYE